MYKSPIELISKEMSIKLEDDICRAIQSYNIDINKEELLKALQYDRHQYEKGYADGLDDGYNKAIKEFAEKLKSKTYPFPCAIGVENAVTIRAINETVEEMAGENNG